MDADVLIREQRLVTPVGHQASGVGCESREERAQDPVGEVVWGKVGRSRLRLVIPCHMRCELLPDIDHRLHRAVGHEAAVAPGFAVGVFGEVPMDGSEEGEVVAFPAEEVLPSQLGGFMALGAAGVGGEEEVLDAEGGDDVDAFAEAGDDGGEEDAPEGGGKGEGGEGAA